MLYLAEKAGKFFPQDLEKKSEVLQWVMFQMGGIGPMQGQAGHFIRFAPESIEYGKKRYLNETERLYGVLDKRLEGRQYLASDDTSPDGYSIADMITLPWVLTSPMVGVDLKNFPNVKAWRDRLKQRPAVQEGLDIPEPFRLRELLNDPEKEEAAVKEGRGWITQDEK